MSYVATLQNSQTENAYIAASNVLQLQHITPTRHETHVVRQNC